MMKLIRAMLAPIVLTIDRLTTPAPEFTRTPADQSRADQETQAMVLFQLLACPFCVKVRREIKRLGLQIRTRDVGTDPSAASELVTQGGQDQVPCLRIEHTDGRVEWMYESDAINSYLRGRFSPKT